MAKQKEQQEPNVALTARNKDGKVDVSKALERINTATGKINLPKFEDQAKPFYHEQRDEIIGAMPHLYKPFKLDKAAK